ncbi:hypothetical protein IM538_07730 [Cytobacillus suaedae]|nr:hypothetical protein IM538_07730 [Cytobacillus suaedae]
MKKNRRKKVKKDNMRGLLGSLPPNYTVGTVYLNGQPVTVTNFVNKNNGLSYFIAEGQVTVLKSCKIDGIGFAPAEVEEPIEEEEEEEAE